MACDMVVAVGPATVGEVSLVGLNRHGVRRRPATWRRILPLQNAMEPLRPDVAPCRQTFAVLGCQASGEWGLSHGLNENRVVAAHAEWQSKMPSEETGLGGAALVRLTLERSQSARHGVEVLTDLVARHGKSSADPRDHVFLIADGREAFIVESAGRFWAMQECSQVRAASDVSLIRQDWRRLSPGLAEHAIGQGWWPDDGSKLDFGGPLAERDASFATALKRWGRATLLLEQQNGHIDRDGVRRLLIEHFDDTVVGRRPNASQGLPQLESSFVAEVTANPHRLPIAWVGLGPVGNELFFPMFVEGEPPLLWERERCGGLLAVDPARLSDEDNTRWRAQLGRLQLRLDQEADAQAAELACLKEQGNAELVRRQATAFMRAQAELLDQLEEPIVPRTSYQPSDLAFVAE